MSTQPVGQQRPQPLLESCCRMTWGQTSSCMNQSSIKVFWKWAINESLERACNHYTTSHKTTQCISICVLFLHSFKDMLCWEWGGMLTVVSVCPFTELIVLKQVIPVDPMGYFVMEEVNQVNRRKLNAKISQKCSSKANMEKEVITKLDTWSWLWYKVSQFHWVCNNLELWMYEQILLENSTSHFDPPIEGNKQINNTATTCFKKQSEIHDRSVKKDKNTSRVPLKLHWPRSSK